MTCSRPIVPCGLQCLAAETAPAQFTKTVSQIERKRDTEIQRERERERERVRRWYYTGTSSFHSTQSSVTNRIILKQNRLMGPRVYIGITILQVATHRIAFAS